jgi:NADPH:quinone reductase-like Zn-dependent oxidoreductase
MLAGYEFPRRADVVASVSSGDPGYIRSLGADEVIDLRWGQLRQQDSAFEAVIDTVGGEIQARSISLLKPGSTLVSAVSQPDERLLAQQGARGVYFIVDVSSESLQKIAGLFDAGSLRAHVRTVFPLAEAWKAHEMLAGVRVRPPGKIVLTP